MKASILVGNALNRLKELRDESVQCVVTSPPYWGLRDYGVEGQLGMEKTPDEYVAKMVEVFREVRRVLRQDGTLWLNLGDSYAGYHGNKNSEIPTSATNGWTNGTNENKRGDRRPQDINLKPKDLVGIPWMLAFALRADGWYLRSEIIWSKPSPMPESVLDRPTKAHEQIFLLSKKSRYFYNAEAIKEPSVMNPQNRFTARADHPKGDEGRPIHRRPEGGTGNTSKRLAEQAIIRTGGLITGGVENSSLGISAPENRNKRSVWEIATQPYPESHFATFPEALIEPCILAGTSEHGACPECGSPYKRIMQKTGWPDPENIEDDQGRMKASGEIATDTQRRKELSGAKHAAFKAANPDVLLGWEPTCKCVSDKPLNPCLVLDPFCGSGTTGVVSLRYHRDFVGCELNPEYASMAERRINNEAPMFNEVEVK